MQDVNASPFKEYKSFALWCDREIRNTEEKQVKFAVREKIN